MPPPVLMTSGPLKLGGLYDFPLFTGVVDLTSALFDRADFFYNLVSYFTLSSSTSSSLSSSLSSEFISLSLID
jgi:hypothetical protein